MADVSSPAADSPFFGGTVQEALAKTNSEGLLLLVTVVSDNDDSRRLNEETWSDAELCELIVKECVALCLDSTSVDAQNFSAIFPVVVVPTTYIVHAGVPLAILSGFRTADEVRSGLSAALEKRAELLASVATPTTSSSSSSSTTTTTTAAASTTNSGVNDSSRVCSSGDGGGGGGGEGEGDESLEERTRKMQEKLRALRRRKAEQAAEEARQREIKRREEGKALLKVQDELDHKRRLSEAEKRRKEKQAAADHLKQVRAQLEADKAERRAQQSKRKRQESRSNERGAAPSVDVEKKQTTPKIAANAKTTRLRFRLPGGKALLNEFELDAKVETITAWLDKHEDVNFDYELLLPGAPPLIVGAEHLTQTLRETGLSAATLMVRRIPSSSSRPTSPSSSSNSSVTSVLVWLFSVVWGLITLRWLFGRGDGGGANNTNTQASAQQQDHKRRGGTSSSGKSGQGNHYANGNSTEFVARDEDDPHNFE